MPILADPDPASLGRSNPGRSNLGGLVGSPAAPVVAMIDVRLRSREGWCFTPI